MTSAERTAIELPAESLLVYDSDTQSFWYVKSDVWVEIGETITEAQVDAFVANNGYLTNADDADADPTNELELPSTNGNSGQFLQTDGAGTVSWATPSDNVNDADADASNELQTLSLSETNLTISDGNTINVSSLTTDENWEVSSGTNITNTNEGNVGIGNIASTQNRWQLTVKDTVNCMLGTDSVDVSELFTCLLYTSPSPRD